MILIIQLLYVLCIIPGCNAINFIAIYNIYARIFAIANIIIIACANLSATLFTDFRLAKEWANSVLAGIINRFINMAY